MSVLFDSFAFGISLTILAYWVGMTIQKKTGLVICNSMLISVCLVIAVLKVFHIPYGAYQTGGEMINLFLGPATVCLAVSIYSKLELLKKYWLPVMVGCVASVATSVGSILVMCRLFGLEKELTISLLPKSVTTPIAIAVAEGQGGLASVAVAAVIITGMLGNFFAPLLVKFFRVRDPIAAGLGIGACSHAMGTAKAMQMGETQGALSGLAIGLCGILTAVAALAFPYVV